MFLNVKYHLNTSRQEIQELWLDKIIENWQNVYLNQELMIKAQVNTIKNQARTFGTYQFLTLYPKK